MHWQKFLAFLFLTSTASAATIFTPGSPDQLTATAVSAVEVALQWQDNSRNETGFHIYHRFPNQGDGSWQLAGTVAADTTEFRHAVPDHSQVEYIVTAFDERGSTEASNVAQVQTPRGFYTVHGRAVDEDFQLLPETQVYLRGIGESFRRSFFGYWDIFDHHTTTIPMDVQDQGLIRNLSVRVNISHSYIGDLRVTLIHPDGTRVVLHNYSGGDDSDINTTYPDSTAPAESLNILLGKPIQGMWSLEVTDSASEDTGVVHGVELSFDSNIESVATTDAEGRYTFSNIISGPYSLKAEKAGYHFEEKQFLLKQNEFRMHLLGKSN